MQKFTRGRLVAISVLAIILAYAAYSLTSVTSVNGESLAPLIDGMRCTASEGSVMHVHPRLSLVLDARNVSVPAGIGAVETRCLYNIHTHDTSGIVHVESPTAMNFTLGELFDVWNKTRTYGSEFVPSNLDKYASVTAYVNGVEYKGDYRNIVLQDGNRIGIVASSSV